MSYSVDRALSPDSTLIGHLSHGNARARSYHVISFGQRLVAICKGKSSCRSTSCHVTSCHVTSCHVMSCHVMSYHVRIFYVDFGCFQPQLSNLLLKKGDTGNLINGSLESAR